MKVYGAPLSAGKSFNRAFQQPEALKRLNDVEHVEIVLTHGPLSTSMWTGRSGGVLWSYDMAVDPPDSIAFLFQNHVCVVANTDNTRKRDTLSLLFVSS